MARYKVFGWFLIGLLVALWCSPGMHGYAMTFTPTPPASLETPPLRVLAIESFLADIAQNVAGQRLTVSSLIPLGVDPHSFELTPGDLRQIVESDVVIINGGGLEEFLQEVLQSASGKWQLIEAAKGLTFREPYEHGAEEGEEHTAKSTEEEVMQGEESHHEHENDPHFWLDPNNVIRYVENIRDGLSQADPAGALVYAQNAETYNERLRELDQWIVTQVEQIPLERRLLVTNHESFGYFADRYGFRVIGTILPGVSTGASPSAQQLAHLIELIKETGAPAIFLETGTNPQLAEQIARDTGVKVVSNLYTHSLSDADGPAPTYLDMMRHNTRLIVEALR